MIAQKVRNLYFWLDQYFGRAHPHSITAARLVAQTGHPPHEPQLSYQVSPRGAL
jgi:hypothetical protein